MNKTRSEYNSGIARPKFDDKSKFELKGQFLKELRENSFSGLEDEDANEHLNKVLEIADLFTTEGVSTDQLMLRIFPISLKGAANKWLKSEPAGSIKTWEDLKSKPLNDILHLLRLPKRWRLSITSSTSPMKPFIRLGNVLKVYWLNVLNTI